MAALIWHLLSSSGLFSLGLYHLFCTTRNHLKSPTDYTAKPYHSLSLSSSQHLKHLPLYFLTLFLLIAFAHQTLISFDSDPLVKGRTPVHCFTSLQSAALLFLFFFLSLSLLLSQISSLFPFSSDLFFAIASALFFLNFSVSSSSASVQTTDLQAECDSISARISALSSLLCLILSLQPKFFVADVGLGASLCLQGLWILQTGLSLYVEAFIPEGCHSLLDAVNGVEGSTKCDLEESRLRAVAILDLVFLVHVMFVVLIVMVVYGAVANSVGMRRFGSYEALSMTAATVDLSHIQMKALAGTQA